MKYIPNAMKFGTQSRSSLLILNMILKNCGSWPGIKNFGRYGLKIAMCFNFNENWRWVQIEQANYVYGIWNWWSRPKIIDLGKFVPTLKFAPIFMKFGTNNKCNMLILDMMLAMV